MGASEVIADALPQFGRCELALGFDHRAFAVNPLGFDRVEPRGLHRQPAHPNPTTAALTHPTVVTRDPLPYSLGFVLPRCPRPARTPSCPRSRTVRTPSPRSSRSPHSPAGPQRTAAPSPRCRAAGSRSTPAPLAHRPWDPSPSYPGATGQCPRRTGAVGPVGSTRSSSWNPSTHSGFLAACAISRSRAFFSWRIRGPGW